MPDNFEVASRKQWNSGGAHPNVAELKLGCLQRIANAMENIAKSADAMECRLESTQLESAELRRKLAAQKALVTRLRNRGAA